jgi:hypothetical protein
MHGPMYVKNHKFVFVLHIMFCLTLKYFTSVTSWRLIFVVVTVTLLNQLAEFHDVCHTLFSVMTLWNKRN